MKTTYALPVLTLALGGAIAVVAFGGCSSSSSGDGARDTGTDEVADTKTDTKPEAKDTAPSGCADDLPTDFDKTIKPTIPQGSTVCSRAIMQGFYDECFGDGPGCAKWQKDHPACETCALKFLQTIGSYQYLREAFCMQELDPTGTCGMSAYAYERCKAAVCGPCEQTGMTGSDFDNCVTASQSPGSSSKPKGRCYDLGWKQLVACRTDARFANCDVATVDGVVTYLTGACRDNARWENASAPDPTDAGSGG